MFKVSHRTLICLSGLIWLCIGIFLLTLGIFLMLSTAGNILSETRFSLIKKSSGTVGNLQNGFTLLMALALFIGYLKGKFVLSKSAHRQIKYVLSLTSPVSITRIYKFGYYLLILAMIGMGVLLRFLPFAQDVRGFVDAAVGSALLVASMAFFRFAFYGESNNIPNK